MHRSENAQDTFNTFKLIYIWESLNYGLVAGRTPIWTQHGYQNPSEHISGSGGVKIENMLL